ncbi:MAG TPA: hypothetical protein ENI69_08540, partial [Rhodospirillales bacterium]|nr:hypothetical protein [Rhodospirillales bacterium]
MKIVITDVTDMRGGHICVAGWSLDEERMIRPLHGSGHYHWNTNMARDDLLCPGNIITIKPSGQLPVRGNPHAAEDYLIIGEPALSGNLSDVDMVQTATGSVHDSVQSMFGDLFSVEHFVPEDEGFCSLGAIETQSRRMGFDNNYEKL